MANTYRQMYLQVVFAVKHREALLHKDWRKDLFAYMSGILNKRGHFSLAVNGHHDHVHLFFSYNGNELITDLIREIKKSSNEYIKSNQLTKHKFEWQSGYGVFSYSFRERDKIIKYILNQEEHHRENSFRSEYTNLLECFEIKFKDEYLFRFID